MSSRLPRKQTPILSRVRFQAAFERQPTQLPSTPSRRPPFISSCVWPKISLHGPTNPHGSYRLRRAVMSREEKKKEAGRDPRVPTNEAAVPPSISRTPQTPDDPAVVYSGTETQLWSSHPPHYSAQPLPPQPDPHPSEPH